MLQKSTNFHFPEKVPEGVVKLGVCMGTRTFKK